MPIVPLSRSSDQLINLLPGIFDVLRAPRESAEALDTIDHHHST
jgi:hypothetical protein